MGAKPWSHYRPLKLWRMFTWDQNDQPAQILAKVCKTIKHVAGFDVGGYFCVPIPIPYPPFTSSSAVEWAGNGCVIMIFIPCPNGGPMFLSQALLPWRCWRSSIWFWVLVLSRRTGFQDVFEVLATDEFRHPRCRVEHGVPWCPMEIYRTVYVLIVY